MKFLKFTTLLVGLSFAFSISGAQQVKEAKKLEKGKNLQQKETLKQDLWFTDFQKASALAKKKKLYLFVLFTGSDWCPWCVKLEKEILSKKRFLNFAKKHFVLVFLDFPNKKPQSQKLKQQNRKLASKYGVRGFPTVLIMNPEGKVLAQTGYQDGGATKYVKHLKKILKNIKSEEFL